MQPASIHFIAQDYGSVTSAVLIIPTYRFNVFKNEESELVLLSYLLLIFVIGFLCKVPTTVS